MQLSFSIDRQAALIHYAHLSAGLPPVVNQLSPFFVASKLARYKDFSRVRSLGNTLRWRFEFSVTGIQAFNRIRGVNDFPDIPRELKNRHDNIPVFYPAFHGDRIFGGPFFNNPFESFQPFTFGNRIVNSRLWGGGKRFHVF